MKLDINRWRGSVIKSNEDYFFMSFQPRVTELDDAIFSLVDECPAGTSPREILRKLRERAQVKAREHRIAYVNNLDQAPVELPPAPSVQTAAPAAAATPAPSPQSAKLDEPFFSSPVTDT